MVYKGTLPATGYSGVGRVVWSLTKALDTLGHSVTLLTNERSVCPYAKVMQIDPTRRLSQQIPAHIDIVHYHCQADEQTQTPYIVTVHTAGENPNPLDHSVFLSQDHAMRGGSSHYIYNGIDWETYGEINLTRPRRHHHFLGDTASSEKNLRGAINIMRGVKGSHLKVLGGGRLSLHAGISGLLSRHVSYCGVVNDMKKRYLLEGSRGLIYPVLWEEPFGLALIESLYFGAPIFGTKRGSLMELTGSDFGYLSNSEEELREAIREGNFSPTRCHQYAYDCFNSHVMALQYLKKYETIITKKRL